MYLFQVRVTDNDGKVRNVQFYAPDSVTALMNTIDRHKAHDKKVEILTLGEGMPQIHYRRDNGLVRSFHTQEQYDSYRDGYTGLKDADMDTEALGSFVGVGNIDAYLDDEAVESTHEESAK